MLNGMRAMMAASALALGVVGPPATAQDVGVAVSNFDDNFLTLLREAMTERAQAAGADLQFEDAQREVGRQLSQVENFVATGLDAVIVAPVDSDSTVAMSAAAENGGVPLVYVNNLPVNIDTLPDDQAFVGSDEYDAGNLQGMEVCRLLKEQGKDPASVIIMLGDLSNQATRLRTQAVKDVMATPDCAFMQLADEQTAMWQRIEASNLMSNWLSSGIEFDAVVANNDEMALGAVQALKAAGVSMDEVVVAGVDATPDALQSIAAGDLDVTVFQDAVGQGDGAVDAAMKLAAGEEVEQKIMVPFKLVTPENLGDFQ